MVKFGKEGRWIFLQPSLIVDQRIYTYQPALANDNIAKYDFLSIFEKLFS